MARVLISSWPFPGHLFPQIAVAQALRDRGHVVMFYTGSRAASVLAREGFDFEPFRRIDERRVYDIVFNRRRGSVGLAGWSRFGQTLRQWLLDTVPAQVADLDEISAEWKPDAIVTDPTFWAPILVLHEARGIPVVVSSFVPACMVPGHDAPPFGLGLPPPSRWDTRLLSRIVAAGTTALTSSFRRQANDVRRRFDLPPIAGSVTEHAGRMPLYLVPATREFDYGRHDVPASVYYVGPYAWNPPGDEGPPAWFRTLPRNEPWVHVTEGTVHVGKPFVLSAAARGLGGLAMQVLMTTADDRDVAALGLGDLAPNVHIARWLSHRDLLPRTDVVVTTGGAGTVLAALSVGVPLVIVPTEWDKPENAARVVASGAGIRLSPRRCTPSRLRDAVQQVLRDCSFRQSARALAERMAAGGGATRAAELIRSLLESPQRI